LLVMNDYEKFRPLLEANKAILVIGEVSTGEDKPKIFPQDIMPLEDAAKKYTKQVHLRLNTAHLKPADMERVHELTDAHPGKCPLFLCFMRPEGATVFVGAHERFAVMPSLELEQAANKLSVKKLTMPAWTPACRKNSAAVGKRRTVPTAPAVMNKRLAFVGRLLQIFCRN